MATPKRTRFTKGKLSPILVQRMHCVPQHFVSVHYSLPLPRGKLQRLQTRTRLASTASSSETLSNKLRKCFTMRRDAASTHHKTSSKLCPQFQAFLKSVFKLPLHGAVIRVHIVDTPTWTWTFHGGTFTALLSRLHQNF